MRLLAAAAALVCVIAGAYGVATARDALSRELAGLSAERLLLGGQTARARARAQDALQRQQRPDYRHLERLARIENALGRSGQAQRHWNQAIQARPSWPYAWAQRAQAELRTTPDYERAQVLLQRSAELGDEERGLWKFYAALALASASDPLPNRTREFLEQHVEREFALHATHLMGYALRRRQETALCAIVTRTQPEPYWCQAARYARPICDQAGLTREQARWCDQLQQLWQRFDYPAS